MLILLFSLITALLGAVVKYKRFNYKLFLRTPLMIAPIYYFLYFINIKINIILLSVLLEKWLMFIYKIIIACVNDNYNIKYGYID